MSDQEINFDVSNTPVGEPDCQIDDPNCIQNLNPPTEPEATPEPEKRQEFSMPVVSVYPKEFSILSASDSSDLIEIVVTLAINTFDCSNGTSNSGTVDKKLTFSKTALLADLSTKYESLANNVIESKKLATKTTIVSEQSNAKTTAQRMMELAGIPNSKNYV